MTTKFSGEEVALHLGRQFSQIDCVQRFAPIKDRTIAVDGQPFLKPYVPFIGSGYRPGGVLVYATAQNLARSTEGRHDPRQLENPMYRLWPGNDPTGLEDLGKPPNLGIAPWDEGLLPAVVAVLEYALTGVRADVTTVRRSTAITNFFKFSLFDPDRQDRDFNPLRLPRGLLEMYNAATIECFVLKEIENLRPSRIVCFSYVEAAIRAGLSAVERPKVYAINDPGWIKRGMSGQSKAGSAWRVASESISEADNAYIRSLISECTPGKAHRYHIYLAHYLARWRKQ